MPRWVDEGFESYRKRLRGRVTLELVEIPLATRKGGRNSRDCKAEEGARLLEAAGTRDRIVILDERGAGWSTRDLSKRLERWLMDGRNVSILMGGPDGLSAACLNTSREQWSLSAMTLPHGMVRVLVAEQLYRALSILENHPYHRE